MLKNFKYRLRQGKTVKIYPNSTLDDFIEYLSSKTGLSATVLLFCGFLAVVTATLLVSWMQKTEHLSGHWSIPTGSALAILLELFAFICAIRGLVLGSVAGVAISILTLHGTFGSQYFADNSKHFFELATWDFMYLLTWVLSFAVPAMIGYLSHQIKQELEWEEMAKEKLKTEDPLKYEEIYGNF